MIDTEPTLPRIIFRPAEIDNEQMATPLNRFDLWQSALNLPRERMAASFRINADLWVISRSMVEESRALLASMRDGQRTDALLRNSRTIIDESRRLLAALERAASPRRSDDAHHDAIAVATVAPIEPSAGVVRADADCNPAMLSVRFFKKGSCFGWAVYSTTNELLGRGNAETEHKARIDAFQAGMTYIDRLKGRSVPRGSALH